MLAVVTTTPLLLVGANAIVPPATSPVWHCCTAPTATPEAQPAVYKVKLTFPAYPPVEVKSKFIHELLASVQN